MRTKEEIIEYFRKCAEQYKKGASYTDDPKLKIEFRAKHEAYEVVAIELDNMI